MSVIIRLQNLPWSANALDIRQYFHGLSIPEGGVHIVGGEQGDAFIAFSTDEDARQAFGRNNGKIKEIQINLQLSSRTEMQKVIEAARAQSYAAFMAPPSATPAAPLPAAVPQIAPTAVPEVKKESKRDRKRSRSRDRKDRRRHRDRSRSRSRSRERRERRRRDRSRSRVRSRSRDRKNNSRDTGKRPSPNERKEAKKLPEVWAAPATATPPEPQAIVNANPVAAALLSNLGSNLGGLEEARRNLGILNIPMNGRHEQQFTAPVPTNFPQMNQMNRMRDSWPPQNLDKNNFMDSPDDMALQRHMQGQFPQRRFPRNNFIDYGGMEREPCANTCVKLQPFYGGYGDIRRFFYGSFISNVGIKFINDEYGHRTGIVAIQFGHPQGKLDALRRNGELLNGEPIEILHMDDKEFDEAMDRFQPENNFGRNNEEAQKGRSKNITKYFNSKNDGTELTVYSCVKVEDLPTYVKEQDILKLFSPRPLLALFLTPKPRGGFVAYVKFSSADEARKALEEKPNYLIEGKPVTVKPCDEEEFERINQQHNMALDSKEIDDDSNDVVEIIDTDCVRLSNLPPKGGNIEITDFFSDIGVRPIKIHRTGNRSGQAYCEFLSKEDAAKALGKNGANFGPNQVTVEPIQREDMEHALIEMQNAEVAMQMQQQQQQQQPVLQPRPMMNNNNAMIRPPFFPRGGFDMNMRGGPRFMGPRGPPRPRYNEEAPPGCTVFLDNVPYKAGTNEILDFFDGYDVTNQVSRRFNPNNTPSAEAKVVFTSAEEAFRAVQEKSGHKIWDRSIYLTQA